MSVADEITRIKGNIASAYTAASGKGATMPAVQNSANLSGCIDSITTGGGEPSGEWQPNPNWWDIRKILDEDTRDYAGKVGVILYNFNDVSDFQLTSWGLAAVATSDGAFYTYANNGSTVSHNWDASKDKDDSRGFKTRWVIYYYMTDTTDDRFQQSDTKFGWAYNYIAYLVLRINCSNSYSFCYNQRFLEEIDNVGYSISGTIFGNFCSNCSSLTRLPDGLDTSNGTNFNYFCNTCYSLARLPDVFDTSNGTNFGNFCYYCSSLQKMPEITMVANTTAITSKYSGPFYGMSWIVELPLILPSNTNFWLDMSTRISIESFRYIADHAPDVTATPRTLTVGSANITRINEADPTIITDLNAKGWTVA